MRVTFTLTMPRTKTEPLSSDIQYIIYYYQKYVSVSAMPSPPQKK